MRRESEKREEGEEERERAHLHSNSCCSMRCVLCVMVLFFVHHQGTYIRKVRLVHIRYVYMYITI